MVRMFRQWNKPEEQGPSGNEICNAGLICEVRH